MRRRERMAATIKTEYTSQFTHSQVSMQLLLRPSLVAMSTCTTNPLSDSETPSVAYPSFSFPATSLATSNRSYFAIYTFIRSVISYLRGVYKEYHSRDRSPPAGFLPVIGIVPTTPFATSADASTGPSSFINPVDDGLNKVPNRKPRSARSSWSA